VTGTFGGSFENYANNRSYPFTYTISSANTFEYKTITVSGDTSGTWEKTNSGALIIWWDLGIGSNYQGTAGAWAGSDYRTATGSTQFVTNAGATFYITGVQLEVGTNATSFDYRPYGTELALCQRYYYKNLAGTAYQSFATGVANATNLASVNINHPVVMRSNPTLTYGGTTGIAMYNGAFYAITAIGSSYGGTTTYLWQPTIGTNNLTAQGAYVLTANNDTTAFIALSAEL
jgi:hypothetical protein